MVKLPFFCLYVAILVEIWSCSSTKLADIPRDERHEVFDHERTRRHKPEEVAQDFDCAARELSYQYALKLQGWRGSLETVYDALQLGTLCNVSMDTRQPKPKSKIFNKKFSNEIFVSTNGSDSNDGTLQNPFLTIEKGLQVTRVLSGDSVIYLLPGTFYLNDTLRLTSLDSGLTISNYYQDQDVFISGGIPLTTNWKPYNVSSKAEVFLYPNTNNVYGMVMPGQSSEFIKYLGNFQSLEDCIQACQQFDENDQVCNSFTWHHPDFNNSFASMCFGNNDNTWGPVPEQQITSGRIVQMNVYVASLSGQNIKSINGLQTLNGEQRLIRARYPNADTETAIFPQGWVMYTENWFPAKQYESPVTILVENPQRKDAVEFQQYSMGLGGPCSIFTPPESYWCSANNSGGGAGQFETPTGLNFFEDSVLGLGETMVNVEDVVIHVWHPAHWAMWMYQVDEYNPSNNSFRWSYGGFQGARGAIVGGGDGGQWYLDNIFEGLDSPNEYYYDPTSELLYYFYNGTGAPNDIQLFASNLKVLIDVSGTQSEPVRDLTIQGINFVNTGYTYLDPHGVPSGGDWAMQRTGAIQFEGTEFLLVENCLFQRLDGNALLLSGYNRNATLTNNEFAWIGDSAMVSWGYTEGIDGTPGNQPRFTTVSGNIVREMGIYEKQASAWFQALSCQNLIEGNIFFNGPRALINFNDGFGGANQISNNLLFNANRETSDQGPFNSWDRLPFVTDVRDGTPSVYPAYNSINNNLMLCNYGSNMCIDNDDGSAYYNNHHNFEIYGGHKSDFGGHNKNTYDSVIAFAQDYANGLCADFNLAVPTFVDGYWNNICIQGYPYVYLAIQTCNITYPEPALMPILGNNTVYNIFGNLTVDCGGELLTEQQFQEIGFDFGTTVHGPLPSTQQIINWGKSMIGM